MMDFEKIKEDLGPLIKPYPYKIKKYFTKQDLINHFKECERWRIMTIMKALNNPIHAGSKNGSSI